MTRKVLSTLLILGGLVSSGYFGTSTVLTEDSLTRDTLVTQISQELNLKENDVEAVVQAVKDEREYEYQKDLRSEEF